MNKIEGSSLPRTMNDAVRFRTLVVLCLIFLSAVVDVLRLLTADDQSITGVPVGIIGFFVGIALYEGITLIWLSWIRNRETPLPTVWIYVNALIEAIFPTIIGFTAAIGSPATLQGTALGPASHIYAIFIVLSILHVRFMVSIFAGLIAAIGLASMFVVSTRTDGLAATEILGLPRSLELYSAVLLLLTGAAAALVAHRTRTYLETATKETERRMEIEGSLQAASLIQKNLMPVHPLEVSGFEVAGWSRPADETGGDFFDWFELDDGRVIALIADVTGHGLAPAMITCYCRAYARTSFRAHRDQSTALSMLNNDLVNELTSGRFVTFAAVEITPDNDVIKSISAGHGPLLLFKKSADQISVFGADTIPLGISASDEHVLGTQYSLSEGDTYLMVTDCFVEWMNPEGQQYGLERLKKSLATHSELPPEELIQSLVVDIAVFSGSTRQPDDLTAVVIRKV